MFEGESLQGPDGHRLLITIAGAAPLASLSAHVARDAGEGVLGQDRLKRPIVFPLGDPPHVLRDVLPHRALLHARGDHAVEGFQTGVHLGKAIPEIALLVARGAQGLRSSPLEVLKSVAGEVGEAFRSPLAHRGLDVLDVLVELGIATWFEEV